EAHATGMQVECQVGESPAGLADEVLAELVHPFDGVDADFARSDEVQQGLGVVNGEFHGDGSNYTGTANV
ncbi:MAG: hypothetical protein WA110_00415, partial [Anaerolineaceae bacterium]